MRTANNTNSNYTVENLVAKYRNYVKEHCPKTLACHPLEDGFVEISNDNGSMESLLLSLYTAIAGDKANKYVVKALEEYSQIFQNNYKNALTDEEYAFLIDNFSSFTSFLFLSVNPFSLVLSKPSRITLIQQYLSPKEGDTIFIANTGFDMPCIFPYCNYMGYFGREEAIKEWAFGQIFLFAKGIHSEIDTCVFYEGIGYKTQLPKKNSMGYIVYGAHEDTTYNDILSLYETLAPNGRMLVFVDKYDMQGRDDCYRELRKRLVEDKAISSIIAYQDIDPTWDTSINRLLLVIDKAGNDFVNIESLCSNRKCTIPAANLNPAMLWPGYYLAIRPENGLPLSKLCFTQSKSAREDYKQFKERLGGKIHWESTANGERLALPDWVLNLPIASQSEMSNEYRNANLCNKALLHVSDPRIDEWRSRIRIVDKPCIILSGGYKSQKRFVLGYYDNIVGDGYARMSGQPCLYPQDDVDVRYLAAILLIPSVYEQILSVCDEDNLFGSNLHYILDMVIVPNHDEKERLAFLAETNYDALLSSQETLKQEAEYYKKSIRLRKHALSQSFSAMKAMFSALNDCRMNHNGILSDKDKITPIDEKTVQDAFEFLADRFKSMGYRLDHIADIDYSFSTPEWIDPEKFIENYVEKNKQGWINFKSQYSWEKGHNIAKEDLKDPSTRKVLIKCGESLHSFYFSHDALERIMNNIISNAQAHGFTDKNRNDYILRFSWHLEGTSLIIEIENNGTPIPSDRNTSSLLEYGVSTALNKDGHNGIGCNEIDNIMHKYDGNVKIVSSPNEVYTVKYVLTFENTNSIDIHNM